ncbi:DUF4304 domain-containing protein [Piscinibacter terrae]|uniref:DUF4304 domain-containing protein n=1 Tax=Piscinibacter terrae TaxID=2496871 RepID=UPI0013874C47|nr:DUF4304 domain-containing protein [Albitalea terrae]
MSFISQTQDLRHAFDLMLRRLASEDLAPLGFRCSGHTLSRDRGDHVQHFQFQGSQGNQPDAACAWYLNCGIDLPGIPMSLRRRVAAAHPSWWGWAPHILWASRAEGLVPQLPDRWVIDHATDLDAMRSRLAEVLPAASHALDQRSRQLRRELWLFRLMAPLGRMLGPARDRT